MKISLIDIDSKIPNLALAKIAKYHTDKGDEVIWNMPLYAMDADKTYVSCVFDYNKHKCREWEGKAIIGGSGYSLDIELPEEIEQVKPRINYGFTTRGCIRKCPFCIVPKKEGKMRIVGDIYDLWDGKNKNIILMDNNILAMPEHFRWICHQIRTEKLKVDFNQGLDCRLLCEDICHDLFTISHFEYRFSFDDMSVYPYVEKSLKLLNRHNINRCRWYVLVGYNTTFEEDLERINYLRGNNQNVYVQRYNNTKERKYIPLARWANQPHIFRGMTWEQFIKRPENKKYWNITRDSEGYVVCEY